jgi:hypothetical protein
VVDILPGEVMYSSSRAPVVSAITTSAWRRDYSEALHAASSAARGVGEKRVQPLCSARGSRLRRRCTQPFGAIRLLLGQVTVDVVTELAPSRSGFLCCRACSSASGRGVPVPVTSSWPVFRRT